MCVCGGADSASTWHSLMPPRVTLSQEEERQLSFAMELSKLDAQAASINVEEDGSTSPAADELVSPAVSAPRCVPLSSGGEKSSST